MLRSATVVTLGLALVGCADVSTGTVEVSVSHVGRRTTGEIAASVGLADVDGQPITLSAKNNPVTVETRRGDASKWRAATHVVADFSSPPLIDVMVVVDNSASEASHLADIEDALAHFSHVILARGHADRVGLERVSTVASVVQPLTSDAGAVDASIGTLFISNGYTALWDGVRQANEALVAQRVAASGTSSCYAGAAPSIIVFTDGKDNNSADEHPTRYVGDGVDTTLDDLVAMKVDGIHTAVYTVGVGDHVDDAALEQLAQASGGKHVSLQDYGQLVGALRGSAAKLQAMVPVCFTPASCADDQAHVTVETQGGTLDVVVAIEPACP